jgi:hypothetical protein
MHQHTRARTNDAGRARAGNTNGESKVRCLEREGTVGVREEEQRWRDGEQESWSSPRCRIETALNPGGDYASRHNVERKRIVLRLGLYEEQAAGDG